MAQGKDGCVVVKDALRGITHLLVGDNSVEFYLRVMDDHHPMHCIDLDADGNVAQVWDRDGRPVRPYQVLCAGWRGDKAPPLPVEEAVSAGGGGPTKVVSASAPRSNAAIADAIRARLMRMLAQEHDGSIDVQAAEVNTLVDALAALRRIDEIGG